MRNIPVCCSTWAVILGVLVLGAVFVTTPALHGQSVTATLSGNVVDQSGAAVPEVKIAVTNENTNFRRQITTSKDGSFVLPQLDPGKYKLQAFREGFALVEVRDIVLSTADRREIQIKLKIGKATETITVEADTIEISAAVGLVVGPRFVENMPLNGRTMQALIWMTPGIVQGSTDFSTNGLRETENYFTIDGVSATAGVSGSSSIGVNMGAGQTVGYSQQGTTSNLVSLEALQEFKIQTSTYAAQFGRLAGSQVQLTTKSGGAQYHGTAYEYLRNDVFDANNWMNNNKGLKKSPLRQNNFGATFSGPLIRNKTTFFANYEGSRLRTPQTVVNQKVPDQWLRDHAVPELAPLLKSYPSPNGGPYLLPAGTAGITDTIGNPATTHEGLFNAGYATSSTLNAGSIKIDHVLSKKVTISSRYNQAPSYSTGRTLAVTTDNYRLTKTLTLSANMFLNKNVSNSLKYNWTAYDAGSDRLVPQAWMGAEPLPVSAAFPMPLVNPDKDYAYWNILSSNFQVGTLAHNLNRQNNITDDLNITWGKHRFGFGVDARKSDPMLAPGAYNANLTMSSWTQFVPTTANGGPQLYNVNAAGTTWTLSTTPADTARINTIQNTLNGGYHNHYVNFSSYAQDSWKILSRLTLDIGVRWDVNPAQGANPGYYFFTGMEDGRADMHKGGQMFPTRWGDVAPRLGAIYQLTSKKNWETVLKGGYGRYYSPTNLAFYYSSSIWPTQEKVNNGGTQPYWYYASQFIPNPCPPAATAGCKSVFSTLGTNSPDFAPKPINVDSTAPGSIIGNVIGIGKDLQSPFTHQFSFSVQQAVGKGNTLTVTFDGNAARHLLRGSLIQSIYTSSLLGQCVDATGKPASCFTGATQMMLLQNKGAFGDTSDYESLKVLFNRRSNRMVTQVNYTWSKALNTSPNGEYNTGAGTTDAFRFPAGRTRGISMYNRTHIANASFSYDIPGIKSTGPLSEPVGRFVKGVANGWSVALIGKYESALPMEVYYQGLYTDDRPDGMNFSHKYWPEINPNVPLWLPDPDLYPLKMLNYNAFIIPGCKNGTGASNMCPGGENGLPLQPAKGTPFNVMGFNMYQANLEIRRKFKLTEKVSLDFIGDLYNVANHPSFLDPSSRNIGNISLGSGTLTSGYATTFGRVTNVRSTSPYQYGGPRSCQFAFKLNF